MRRSEGNHTSTSLSVCHVAKKKKHYDYSIPSPASRTILFLLSIRRILELYDYASFALLCHTYVDLPSLLISVRHLREEGRKHPAANDVHVFSSFFPQKKSFAIN